MTVRVMVLVLQPLMLHMTIGIERHPFQIW